MRVLVLALATALAGCDLAAVPDRTNPYDPAFDGTRTATAPSDVHLAGSTLTSVTLAWTDNSSFETGVRVERTYEPERAMRPYETLAVLPPDATTFTDVTVVGGTDVRYRITALAQGERESAPSDGLTVRYPAGSVALAEEVGDVLALSLDGETVYARPPYGPALAAVDARTGNVLGAIDDVFRLVGALADGRDVLAGFTGAAYDQLVVAVVRRGTVVQRAELFFGPTGGYSGGPPLAVSADGARIASLVYGYDIPAAVRVWPIVSGAAPETFPLDPLDSFASFLAGLSADGRAAFVGSRTNLRAAELATGRALWSAPVSAEGAIVSPDASVILAARPGGGLALLDAATGAMRAMAAQARFPAAFSADGQRIVFTLDRPVGPLATEVVQTEGLAPVVTFFQGDQVGYISRPTASGLVSAVGFPPDVRVARFDFSRGWETVP